MVQMLTRLGMRVLLLESGLRRPRRSPATLARIDTSCRASALSLSACRPGRKGWTIGPRYPRRGLPGRRTDERTFDRPRRSEPFESSVGLFGRGSSSLLSSVGPWRSAEAVEFASNGSTGSTIVACSNRSEISRPPRRKRVTMSRPMSAPSRRDSNQTAAGKPGAAQPRKKLCLSTVNCLTLLTIFSRLSYQQVSGSFSVCPV
jgi:hypothetical protein